IVQGSGLCEGRSGRTAIECCRRTRWSGRVSVASAGFIHSERSAFERLIVELADGLLRVRFVCEIDKSEPAVLAGFAIYRHEYIRQVSHRREVRTNLLFACVIGKVPDEKTN